MADKVLVTGVSGFLGGHVAARLLDAGYEVRGSLRDLKKAGKVHDTLAKATESGSIDRLELVGLNLTEDGGWATAAQGCRYIQHVASPFVLQMPKDRNDLVGPAVAGTRRALQAGLAARVERIVLTSSFAAIGYGHPPGRATPFSESDWTNIEGADVSAYVESKTRAEREAWAIMEAAGRRQDLATINPTAILGPLLDDDPGTSNALVLRLLNGTVPAAPRISFGIVDVRDVAELPVKAMLTPGAGGQRYLASSGNLSFIEAARILRPVFPAYAGKIPRFELPDWMVRLYSLVDADVRSNLDSLGVVKQSDARKAEALLGHPFITPADATIATARSLIEQGLV